MAKKPVITYIEDGHWRSMDDNPYRDALIYFLREQCGCDVVVYRYEREFEDDFPRLKKDVQFGLIIAVIVRQEEYIDQHISVISKVRSDLSMSLPIVVIPDGRGEKRFVSQPGDPLVYAFNHTDPGLLALIGRLKTDWKPPLNWLGAETEDDQAIMLRQLEHAYRKNYLGDNDDAMLGTPDHNHQIVAEALRLKLLPPIFLKAEFDDTIKRKTRVFAIAQPSVYWEEIDRINKMTDIEREGFDHRLMRAQGHEPAPGGGVFVTRASCGENVNGYAIDPVTLQTHITYRYGEHHMAKQILAHRIEVIEKLHGANIDPGFAEEENRLCKWRLFSGLIFSKIDGFTVPILRLFYDEKDLEEMKNLKKIAGYLRGQQQFIPIDHYGKVLEG